MKKLLVLLLLVCPLFSDIMAQEVKTTNTKEWTEVKEGDDEVGHYIATTKYNNGDVLASGSWKNWTITATIGPQLYIGDNDWKTNFTKRIVFPAVDLYLNKWVSPSFGVGIGFTYSPFKGLYQGQDIKAAFQTDDYHCTYKGKDLYWQEGHTFNPYAIALFDLDNIFGGFNPNRTYNLSLYAGGGVILGNDPVQTRVGATFNMGFFNIFRLSNKFDLMLNVRGSIVSDAFDGESRSTEPESTSYIRNNTPFDVTCGITVGGVYHFGSKNKRDKWEYSGETTKTYTGYAEAQKNIVVLQAALAKSQEENQQLREQKIAEKEVIKDPSKLWYHVQFKIDKWNITNRELVNLEHVAEAIREAPNTKFSICGYADVQTATPKHNLMLSKNRVNEVFKVLTKRFGVNPDQLVKDYKGGVDLMFYQDNILSRCVVIKVFDGESQPKAEDQTNKE